MSTTSTVITIIICALLVVAICAALVKGIWTVSKAITVPIQIALFVVMLVCVVRLFCTKENAKKLYNGIEEAGIGQNVESTMRTALNLKPAEAPKPEVKQVQVAAAPVEPEQPRSATQPVVAPEPPPQAPQTVIAPEPAPVKVVDYSHLNKGKKSFSYALPFNASVTVGFKENTYRVIAESLGTLSGSEKKEIGSMILTSLGKYVGKDVRWADNSKVSIESRYDESDNRTRVFAIVPPDAID